MSVPPKTALVVEDDDVTLELETRVLRRMGLKVCTASSGAEAIRALNSQLFSIVLLDHKLPDGASWPVLDAALSERTPIPVIIVTAMGDERVAAEAIYRGAAEYVVKSGEFWEQLPLLVDRAIKRCETECAQAHLASIVESSRDPIVSITPSGTIQSWNAAAAKAYGHTAEAAIGAHISILSSIGIECDFPDVMMRLNRGELISELGSIRIGKDDNQVALSLTIAPIKDLSAKIIGMSVTGHDLTERAARQVAEEANKAKSAFLANMSHEIRTPMSAIIGFNYLLQQTSMTIKQNKYAANIARASDNLLTLINDILNLSKVEAGKIELEQIEFDLEEVLSKMVLVTTPLVQQKGLEFKIDIAANVPLRLIGDPQRLGQVLLNLSSNAIKFTEKGVVSIGIELLERSDSNAKLLFKVRDSGIGISPEQRQKLFQPFVQADSTITRKHGGTGLGLVISKQFVNLMQGEIKVDSDPGKGSTFSFTARFGAPAQARKQKKSERLPRVEQCALVIDPITASRTELSSILSDLKFNVTACVQAEEALVEIAGDGTAPPKDFDVILLDGSEAGKDWLSDVIHIRQGIGSRMPPAIILIADRSMADQRMDCKALGLDEIVFKPLTRSAVYDAIVRSRSRLVGRTSSNHAQHKIHDTLKNMRILVVDDEEINQQVAIEILAMAGCEVAIASDGPEALRRIFEIGRLDAVLMDLRMPGMDGIEVTKKARADKRLSELPIIAMTADAVEGVRDTCLAAGMNDYLSKPINPEVLFASLEKWIAIKRQPARSDTK